MKEGKINWNIYKTYKDKGFTGKQVAESADINYIRFCRCVNGKLDFRPAEKRILSQILRQPQKELFKDLIK